MTAPLPEGTTVCVPAWNAAAFLPETLAAVARQDVPGMRVLVSVDGGDAATAAACAPFLADARFAMRVQPARLGWVGNTNALIAAVETRHFAIMPHDDLPEDGWLAALHAALAQHPGAIGTYADLKGFGTNEIAIAQPEVAGPPLARRLRTLLRQYECVIYRGLFRLDSGQPRPLLPAGLPGDVAADTAWLMELACRGEMRRVPRILVRKRYHAGNTHGAWSSLGPEAALAAGIALLGWMRDRAARDLPADGGVALRLLDAAALLRLLGCARPLPLFRRVPHAQRLVAWLGVRDGGRAGLPRVQEVLQHPDAGPLRALFADPACAARLAELASALRDSGYQGVPEGLAALAAEAGAALRG